MSRPTVVTKLIELIGPQIGPAISYIEELETEIVHLKGLMPELPPFPSDPNVSRVLPRFGLRWNGPEQPLAVQMSDGYWTPYHIAKDAIDQRVIDAVAAARKAWAAQGCPEVKALHGAESIREAIKATRDSMTEDGDKWFCRPVPVFNKL